MPHLLLGIHHEIARYDLPSKVSQCLGHGIELGGAEVKSRDEEFG
uniref:Uncharacterized protein n=1 Tax=Rhizophora mucronata TaxID=61149 RepID=A0A2P2QW68_RHIMU